MPKLGEEYIPPVKLHPGSSLAEKLEELELSPQDFARQIDVEEGIVVDIVTEKDEAIITPELADAFEQALKIPAAFWLRKQKRYLEFIANQQVVKA